MFNIHCYMKSKIEDRRYSGRYNCNVIISYLHSFRQLQVEVLHAVGQAALDGLQEAGRIAGEDVAGDGRVATPARPAAVPCAAKNRIEVYYQIVWSNLNSSLPSGMSQWNCSTRRQFSARMKPLWVTSSTAGRITPAGSCRRN